MARPNDIVAYVINGDLYCDGCALAQHPTLRTEEIEGVGEVSRHDIEPGDTCVGCGGTEPDAPFCDTCGDDDGEECPDCRPGDRCDDCGLALCECYTGPISARTLFPSDCPSE